MSTRPPHRPPVRRGGFTIVELLMVVVIIGILAALLIPAIQRARDTAGDAEVLTEIKGLEKGVVDFKNRFGIDPPSFIVLCESAAEWAADWGSSPPAQLSADPTLTDAHRRTSRAVIRQIWPEFDFTVDHDINGDGAFNGAWALNGAECLVFFLGGVPDRIDTDGDGTPDAAAMRGFSANPQRPFLRGGNRIGPFVDFDSDRLIDIDTLRSTGRVGGNMLEYLDTIPGQQLPYQYLSSYDGRGYQPYGLDGMAGTIDDELMYSPNSSAFLGLAYHYLSAPPSASLPNGEPYNRSTCQIISPGRDNEFGLGGIYNGENVPVSEDTNNNGMLDPGEDVNGNGTIEPRTAERDNITNFKGGRLN